MSGEKCPVSTISCSQYTYDVTINKQRQCLMCRHYFRRSFINGSIQYIYICMEPRQFGRPGGLLQYATV